MVQIGIDARITDYRIGGISTYTRQLVRGLERLADDETITICQSRRMDVPISNAFRTCRLLTPPHHRWERLALSAELLPRRFDLFHSVDFIPPYRAARRQIITVHDLTFLHEPEHKDSDARRYYNAQIAYAVSHADHILSVSEATRQDLVTMLDVPEDKITVVHNGVDARFHPLDKTTVKSERTQHNLPESFILFVGTLEPRKNLPTLLDAYTLLDDPPSLLLVGKAGWRFDDTLARIQAMQANGWPIIHRPDITDDALPAVYNAARLLVLPSYYEGFGLPVLEAMACGTPVVTSNTSALPEVVGDAGLTFDPMASDAHEALHAAIKRLLTDTDAADRARTLGIEQAGRFTWDRTAAHTLAAYRQLL